MWSLHGQTWAHIKTRFCVSLLELENGYLASYQSWLQVDLKFRDHFNILIVDEQEYRELTEDLRPKQLPSMGLGDVLFSPPPNYLGPFKEMALTYFPTTESEVIYICFSKWVILKVGQTCLDMQNGPQYEPGLDRILCWLKTLLSEFLTANGNIRFLILIISKARIEKRRFLYVLFGSAELGHFTYGYLQS